MRWPWSRPSEPETRADASDLAVAALHTAASSTPATAAALASVVACAALLARVCSLATVSGRFADVVTPVWIAEAVRDMAMHGESVYRIDVNAGGLRLDRASACNVEGGADPATWRYVVTIPGPTTSVDVTLPRASVLHLTYATERRQPWRGTPPWKQASLTAGLAAELERRLHTEAAAPSGYVLGMPGDDPDKWPDLGKAKGGTLAISSVTGAGWSGGAVQAPRREVEARRFGISPPQTLQGLRWDLQQGIVSCYGIAVELLAERASGGSDRRASWAELIAGTARPLLVRVEDELRRSLDDSMRLVLDDARAQPVDLLARARVAAALVESGRPIDEALATAGLTAARDQVPVT